MGTLSGAHQDETTTKGNKQKEGSVRMKFVEEAENMTRTENAALAYRTTRSATVDLFFTVGASRGRDIVPLFVAALGQNRDDAVRIALWARDVRGGAGERKLFRDMLEHVEGTDMELFRRMAGKVGELGRWDDVLVARTAEGREHAAGLVRAAIEEEAARGGRSLAAKWMPREGAAAQWLRQRWGMTAREYRKYLVSRTSVVETRMCGGAWDEIDFGEVPSLALARYTAAFRRHAGEKFEEFLKRVRAGEARVSGDAVYPYDVLKTLRMGEADVAEEQWKALPDYMGGGGVLAMVDVSGSMGSRLGPSLTCMDVAVSLGLYIATRQQGAFAGLVLTFHREPAFTSVREKQTLKEKVETVERMPWGGNTDVCRAFDLILRVARSSGAGREDMPRTLVILSDMEFDDAVSAEGRESTVYEAYGEKFREAGYERPTVVFWNLQSRNRHVPVRFDEAGTVLVSGFSPSLMRFVVGEDPSSMTPVKVMESVIRDKRYDF